MNQSYEMIYILRPDLIEEQVKQQVTQYEEFLAQYKVQNLTSNIWGKRRLAYPIQKFQDGIYVQLNYQADGTQVAPLEREMRLSELVIRFLTIRLGDVAKPETEEQSSPVVETEAETETVEA